MKLLVQNRTVEKSNARQAAMNESKKTNAMSLDNFRRNDKSAIDSDICARVMRIATRVKHIEIDDNGKTNLSKQIIDAHNGRVWVKSKVNEGSEFIVKL